MTESIYAQAQKKASVGMEIAEYARLVPDRIAVQSEHGNLSYYELNAQANQIANLLRVRGIKEDDSVALLCGNRPEFIAVRFATYRMGVKLVTVNWHLSADEIAYILDNSDAKALFADIRVAEKAISAVEGCPGLNTRVAVGGAIQGFDDWHSALASQSSDDIDKPSLGGMMLYTSGTTGRPKGVVRKQPDPQAAADMMAMMVAVFQFDTESGTDLALTTGPLYHMGPFNLCMTIPIVAGCGCVVMDKWDPELTLQLIQKHKITHSFFVPTMFHRLLHLSDEVRKQYDVSTLKFVIHGAAPCLPDVKHQMLAWWGPVIWEMMAGTEGPGTIVSPQEWLEKPGTVGKPGPDQIRILDEEGNAVLPGVSGQLYWQNPPQSAFEYHKDSAKTASVMKDGYFTAGDVGYLDEDGYLFLTGRSAETIIAGGVNIYPQEIDDILLKHDAVADVACVGVPHPQWGEEVKAVVQLKPNFEGTEQLAEELIRFVQPQLAKQKWPRSIDFIDQLPRSEAGKVQRKQLRAGYWDGQKAAI